MTDLSEATLQAVLLAERDDEIHHCLVCYADLAFVTVTDCGHNEICGVCYLRLRMLHHDKKCPICKTEQGQVIVDQASTAKTQFRDYPVWGNDLGPDFVYEEDVAMFIRRAYYEIHIQPLFRYACQVARCSFDAATAATATNTVATTSGRRGPSAGGTGNKTTTTTTTTTPLRALQDHLRLVHRMALCQLCVDNSRDFVARLPRFTPSALQHHLKQGDGKLSGFNGHPLCEFCKPTRFYDLTALHQHLVKEHYKCHVCEQLGIVNQYFKHYQSLEKHFDRQHFLCHDVQCLTARFVVFANELDLRHHERQVHGGTSVGDSKIKLEFRIRRVGGGEGTTLYGANGATDTFNNNSNTLNSEDFNYGLDGQPFVPPDLPVSSAAVAAGNHTSRGGDSNAPLLHPLHVQRTAELREQAAALRGEFESIGGAAASGGSGRGEAFPTLQQSHGNSLATQSNNADNALRMGWTSGSTTLKKVARRGAGTVTEEDFPSLPTVAKPKTKTVKGMTAIARPAKSSSNISSANNVLTQRSTTMQLGDHQSMDLFPSLSATASRGEGVNENTSNIHQHGYQVTTEEFPALASSKSTARAGPQPTRYPVAETFVQQRNQRDAGVKPPPPNLNSINDFPAPPQAQNLVSAARNRIMETRGSNGPTAPAIHGMSMTDTAYRNVTVEEMKMTLGAPKYKQLKTYTKAFATSELAPDSFVDHAASLFDRGYADVDFWRFLPNLIESIPNPFIAEQAKRYLNDLRRMRNGAVNAEAHHQSCQQQAQQKDQLSAALGQSLSLTTTTSDTKLASGIWTSAPRLTSSHPTSVPPLGSGSAPYAPVPRKTGSGISNSWDRGAGGRPKPPPSSTTEGVVQGNKSKQIKKKQKNELKALAFST